SATLQPIGYDKVRRDTGKSVEPENVIRGFEVEKGRFVPLEETGKVGIAKVVIRNKQHLAALRVRDGILVLETMYYADEVRQPEHVDGKRELRRAEVEMAKSLVENLSAPFEPAKYDDRYRKELLELLRAKAKGKKLPEPQEEEEAEVVDLMAALRESVKRTKQQKKKPQRKRRA